MASAFRVRRAGCHRPGRDSAVPSRAARSIGSRCVSTDPRTLRPSLARSAPGMMEHAAFRLGLPMAAAGPAPRTGGGTEEAPGAGPGGGPPPERWLGRPGAARAPPGRVHGVSERAPERIPRRERHEAVRRKVNATLHRAVPLPSPLRERTEGSVSGKETGDPGETCANRTKNFRRRHPGWRPIAVGRASGQCTRGNTSSPVLFRTVTPVAPDEAPAQARHR
jgi:hypothetical protein